MCITLSPWSCDQVCSFLSWDTHEDVLVCHSGLSYGSVVCATQDNIRYMYHTWCHWGPWITKGMVSSQCIMGNMLHEREHGWNVPWLDTSCHTAKMSLVYSWWLKYQRWSDGPYLLVLHMPSGQMIWWSISTGPPHAIRPDDLMVHIYWSSTCHQARWSDGPYLLVLHMPSGQMIWWSISTGPPHAIRPDDLLNSWTLAWNQMVHMWHIVYGPRLTIEIPNAKFSMCHGEEVIVLP